MLDQAHDLRRLAIERSRPMTADSTARPTLLAVTGGKGGVGTTTIAINLATALAATGKRPLLVDADPRGGDAALWCDIQERYTLADLLAGRRTWTEVIEPAAGGVRLVAGARWSDDVYNGSSTIADQLLELLGHCGSHADVAVLDLGNGPGRAVSRLALAADAIVMVTTEETAAVVSTFAAIKVLAHSARHQGIADVAGTFSPLHVLVNMARTTRDAQMIHGRLGRACHRLLGVNLAAVDSTQNDSHCQVSVPRLPLGGGVGYWSRLLHLEIVCPKNKKG